MQLTLVPRANRLAQWRNPSRGRVLRLVLVNCADRRLLDVLRRRKVRLAGAEIGHVDAFRFHLFRFGEYGRGRRDLDTVNAVSQLHFQLLRRWASLQPTVYKQDAAPQTPNWPAKASFAIEVTQGDNGPLRHFRSQPLLDNWGN